MGIPVIEFKTTKCCLNLLLKLKENSEKDWQQCLVIALDEEVFDLPWVGG